jgi:hypothetical protein
MPIRDFDHCGDVRAGRRENLSGTIRRPVGFSLLNPKEEIGMDHSQHTRLSTGELTPAVLEGATIYDDADHKVGTVSHVHGSGLASQVVVDVGGFLGMGAKPVAVPATELDFMRDEKGDVHAVTSWTKDQLKDLPEHKDFH